jgi:hypothetical protein
MANQIGAYLKFQVAEKKIDNLKSKTLKAIDDLESKEIDKKTFASFLGL